MNHLLNSRLGRRLMGCFVLLLAVVASLYAFALQASMEFTESELLSSFMHDEVVAAAKDRNFAVNIENITGTEFFGTAAHLPPIPARYAHLKEGFQEVLDEPPTFAYRLTDDQGNIYVLVRNQKDFESFEERIEQSLTVSVIVVIAIGLLVGAWLTRTVVSPIVKLSGDIKDAARPAAITEFRSRRKAMKSPIWPKSATSRCSVCRMPSIARRRSRAMSVTSCARRCASFAQVLNF